MADFTLKTARFPSGTSLTVRGGSYAVANIPTGPEEASGTIIGGTVTFTGLDAGADYVAYGEVDGIWRKIRFSLDAPSTGLPYGPLREGDYGDGSIPDAAFINPAARRDRLAFNAKDYGAVGDINTDDTAAVLAMLGAAEDHRAIDSPFVSALATGYFPAGIYRLLDTLPVHAVEENTSINFIGDGPYQSLLFWGADLGSGEYGIKNDWPANSLTDQFIKRMVLRDLAVLGRQTSGQAQAATGVRLTTNMTMERVVVAYWTDAPGIEMAGNHQTVSRCWVRECEYGIWLPDVDQSIGDQYIVNTLLTANSLASIGIDNGTAMVAELEDVHLGFCPYGILAEAGGSEAAINRATLSKVYCEAFGNAFIKTNGRYLTNSVIRDSVLRRTDGEANGDAVNAVIDCGAGIFQQNTLDSITFDLSSGSTLPPCFIACGGILDSQLLNIPTIMAKVEASNWPLVKCTGALENVEISWGRKRAILVRADGAITQYQAVGLSAFDSAGSLYKTMRGRAAQTGDLPLGVALHGAADGEAVVVQTFGWVNGVPSGTVSALDPLTVASTGSVAAASAGDSTIGIARAADSGGVVRTFVDTGWLA